jgi:hypothetical protein
MGGLFGGKPSAPATPPPEAAQAPVEEASFVAAGETDKDSALKKKKLGKKQLQIPSVNTTTTATAASTGVGTGSVL